MNAHQRRVARRLQERALGNADDQDDDDGYCQDCGDYISFSDGTAYVTASGDLYCDVCGRAMDEAEEALFDEENEFDLWDYDTWEDIATGETGGRYIGPGSDELPPEDEG